MSELKVRNISEEAAALFPAQFYHYGDEGWVLEDHFANEASRIRNMEVQDDDVWLMTFPRSGTVMMSELLWLLKNDLDFKKASEVFLYKRISMLRNYLTEEPDWFQNTEVTPSPRVVFNHLPFCLLPPSLLDRAKVVFVARDPRDVTVSFFHVCRRLFGFTGTLKQMWNLFITDSAPFCPYMTRMKEAWKRRDHPNLLFMFYEDIVKDKPAAIRTVANFIGKKISDEELKMLCDHMDIESFRKRKWIYQPSGNIKFDEQDGVRPFIGTGVTGGWRELFDDEMRQQAEEWMTRELAGTGLTFSPTD